MIKKIRITCGVAKFFQSYLVFALAWASIRKPAAISQDVPVQNNTNERAVGVHISQGRTI